MPRATPTGHGARKWQLTFTIEDHDVSKLRSLGPRVLPWHPLQGLPLPSLCYTSRIRRDHISNGQNGSHCTLQRSAHWCHCQASSPGLQCCPTPSAATGALGASIVVGRSSTVGKAVTDADCSALLLLQRRGVVARAQDTEQSVEVDKMVKDLQEKARSRSQHSSWVCTL
jgi:hypothetical protein